MAKTFGEKLIEARTEEGMTQEAVATASGLSLTSIQNYESGASSPRASNWSAIAKAVNRPLSYFRSDSSPRPSRGEESTPGVVRSASLPVDEMTDLRQQLLDAKDQKIADLQREVSDLREVALAVFEDFDVLRRIVEEMGVAFYSKSDAANPEGDSRYKEAVKNSYEWVVDHMERQLEALSQRSKRASEQASRSSRDRGTGSKRRRGSRRDATDWTDLPEAENDTRDETGPT